MKILNYITCSVLVALAGCSPIQIMDASSFVSENLVPNYIKEQTEEISSKMTYVIGSENKFLINETPVQIFGSDICPSNDPLMVPFFGDTLDAGKRECIVITPKTHKVKVKMYANNQFTDNELIVMREGKGRTYLKTSDGHFVEDYKIAMLMRKKG